MIKITFHNHVIPVPNLEAGTKITHPRTINANNPHAQKMLHVRQADLLREKNNVSAKKNVRIISQTNRAQTLCKEIVHSTPETNRGKKQVGPQ